MPINTIYLFRRSLDSNARYILATIVEKDQRKRLVATMRSAEYYPLNDIDDEGYLHIMKEKITKPKTELEKQSEFFFSKPVDEYKAPDPVIDKRKYCKCGAEVEKQGHLCTECGIVRRKEEALLSFSNKTKDTLKVYGLRPQDLIDTVHEEIKQWNYKKQQKN
jgi:hypothetical protein